MVINKGTDPDEQDINDLVATMVAVSEKLDKALHETRLEASRALVMMSDEGIVKFNLDLSSKSVLLYYQVVTDIIKGMVDLQNKAIMESSENRISSFDVLQIIEKAIIDNGAGRFDDVTNAVLEAHRKKG